MELSWLVREQVGAERGKLTLLGRLRGVILIILEAPKRILETLGTLLGSLGGILETFGSFSGAMLELGERISSDSLKY